MATVSRPTSPHLTIYRKQMNMLLSIMHRITGVVLYAGLAVFAVFLAVVAYYPALYADLHNCLAGIVGQLVMFGWTLAFYYHFFNGIRHLGWDMGKGFDLPSIERTGWLCVAFTIFATLFTWAVAYVKLGLL